ncbi:hypothetical protein GQX73_g2940 [Xylaria multiplex]|uniref:Uncharacterized protein n=1 Tax=Xylaria multiplex TaxID=323545 RepID=A0A7C8J052_9PEZI|nr:hypothetical protein GQX73_g2940 [Xylaria multiplex]
MAIAQRADLSCWGKASPLDTCVEFAAFVFSHRTDAIVPEPRIRTSPSRTLVFYTKRSDRRQSKQTSFRRTCVAATVVPDSVVNGQDFETAVSRCTDMVLTKPGSRCGILAASFPPTYMLLTAILTLFLASNAGWHVALVGLAVAAFDFSSSAAQGAFVVATVPRP